MIEQKTLAPGERYEHGGLARFFRVMEASAKMSIYFYNNGAEVARAEDVGEGFAETFQSEFDRFVIINGVTGQTIQVAARQSSEINYDKTPQGDVNVIGVVQVEPSQAGTVTQAAVAVNNASGVLLAANAGRSYLFVQNKSATGTIWINLAGVAATQANGIRLEPGESYELSGLSCPAGDVRAIGDIANNPDVVVLELS